MSTFYFSVNMISRGKNQSAVASASYRSGESLYSELDMETKSYKKRSILPETFIDAPKHAPEWVYERERLWNEVELNESKSNSRLAREVRVALPREISNEQQRNLLETFVKENFVDKGMVADVSIHRDVEHNPHAHIMLTMRPFNENGEWGGSKKREYIKDNEGNFVFDDKGKKKFKTVDLVDWNKKQTLELWRENYANIVNQYYIKNNIDERVSHKSYQEQGIDKIPKHRLTVNEFQIEKEEQKKAEEQGLEYEPKTYYAILNKSINKVNEELNNMSTKIMGLTTQKEQFKLNKNEELDLVKNSIKLTDEDWKSIKVISKRVDGYVNINKAHDNLERMKYWNQKLQAEKSNIIAYENLLGKVNNIYKENPKGVLNYGFKPNSFEEDYKDKVLMKNKLLNDYTKKLYAYNEMYKHSKKVYDIQTLYTNKEFAVLYPSLAENMNSNSKSLLLKSRMIEEFKKTGKIYKSLMDADENINQYNENYSKLENLYKEINETKKSLLILQRTKVKLENNYSDNFINWSSDKVFNNSLKYEHIKVQIANKEILKESLYDKLNSTLISKYGEHQKDVLSDIPLSVKEQLLKLDMQLNSKGNLGDDLTLVKNKDTYNNVNQYSDITDNHKESGGSKDNNTGALFSGLINSAKHNDNSKDSLERKRQKEKNRKTFRYIKSKGMGENEM